MNDTNDKQQVVTCGCYCDCDIDINGNPIPLLDCVMDHSCVDYDYNDCIFATKGGDKTKCKMWKTITG